MNMQRQEFSSKRPARDAGNGEKPRHSLSSKLLLLTILFVMIAEILIFVPSVANTRVRWLEDRLRTAAAASIVIEGWESMDLPRPIQDDALMATGTKSIALKTGGMSRLIASSDMPAEVDQQYDLAETGPLKAIGDAFATLFSGQDRIIRVYGPVSGTDMVIDVVMEEAPLRRAMLIYGRNVLALSLIISFMTAGLVFVAINTMMIRPIRRMTASMEAFSREPDNPARIIQPSRSGDELGIAEKHLAGMQETLQQTLKEQQHLANLGLAVSKINHDMRNILASAQLISDRLTEVDDPVVKRFSPKLLRAIDRAVSYTRDVLDYGRAREADPKKRLVRLDTLVSDVRDLLIIDPEIGGDKTHDDNVAVEFVNDVEKGFEIVADSEQLFRVVHNICRNAVEALTASNSSDASVIRRITVSASRDGCDAIIDIDDTGPGMPAKARENLFKAFHGSARAGGTGLGLAISDELVRAHGGAIRLIDKPEPGTRFRITLPEQPVGGPSHRSVTPGSAAAAGN